MSSVSTLKQKIEIENALPPARKSDFDYDGVLKNMVRLVKKSKEIIRKEAQVRNEAVY